MAIATGTRKVIADEFMKMELGEGRCEMVKGEVIEIPPAGPRRGAVGLNAGAIFRDFGRRTGHGHAMGNDSVVIIDEHNVRRPDVQYFSEARWPKAKVGDAPPPIPPDLVVEVRSPSDRWADILAKVADYFRAGVPLVLVLQPKPRTVTIFREDADSVTLADSETLENLPELPGFRCIVSEFFD